MVSVTVLAIDSKHQKLPAPLCLGFKHSQISSAQCSNILGIHPENNSVYVFIGGGGGCTWIHIASIHYASWNVHLILQEIHVQCTWRSLLMKVIMWACRTMMSQSWFPHEVMSFITRGIWPHSRSVTVAMPCHTSTVGTPLLWIFKNTL